MNYINEFKMIGCNFMSGFLSSVFFMFVELDFLIIEGGIIVFIELDMFFGLNIIKIFGLLILQGKLIIKNVNVGFNFLVGFFDFFFDLFVVDISGCGFNVIDFNMFLYNNKIR